MEELRGIRAEIYKATIATQERFAYFFLAASGSAIAFALLRTEGQIPRVWMLPVCLALVCWGISFYLGCEHLLSRSKVLIANWRVLDMQAGAPDAKNELQVEAATRLQQAAERDNANSRRFGRWQYYLFLLGAIFYVLGHIQRLWPC